MGGETIFAVTELEVEIRGQNHDVGAIFVAVGHKGDRGVESFGAFVADQSSEISGQGQVAVADDG